MTTQISPNPNSRQLSGAIESCPTTDRVLETLAVFTLATSLIGLAAALMEVFYAPQVLLCALIVTGIYAFKTRGREILPLTIKPRWQHIAFLLLVALIFRLPTYHYVLGGQDEGLYTNIAEHIDYTGGIAVEDVVAKKLKDSPYLGEYLHDNRLIGYPGLYLAGVYARSAKNTKLEFQFYDVFPVWIALFSGVFGATSGNYALTFFSLISIIFFYRLALVFTRSFNASLIAGGLLALNPLHAFFSKFPATEMPTLAFSLIGFTLLASCWLTQGATWRSRWLWLSVLSFLCLFTTRISGFMYVPLFIIIAMAVLICCDDGRQRRLIQCWTGAVLFAYLLSVAYGLIWSHSYSHDIYRLSFTPLFGSHWKACVGVAGCVTLLSWLVVGSLRRYAVWRLRMECWIRRPANQWLGLIVLGALALCALKIYWLGWTNHYAASDLDHFWDLSGKGWRSASASGLWTLCVFVGPPLVLSFLILAVKAKNDPILGFLRVFVIGFFVFGTALQWFVPYSPYYARYLLSELVPYMILFVVCAWWPFPRGRLRALLSVTFAFSIIYSAAISAAQIGKNENDGAYAALARLIAPIDPHDLILLDTLQRSPDTSLVKTPLLYTFHRDVVTVGKEALANAGYLMKLNSFYDDIFMISSNPVAPRGFDQLDSVRFMPMTYAHTHFFPRRLVPNTDTVLYLYRLDRLPVPLGDVLSFASGQPWGAWLRSGWSAQEPWGVWSDSSRAVLVIDSDELQAKAEDSEKSNGGYVLLLRAKAFVTSIHPMQKIEVSINGAPVAQYEVVYPDSNVTMRIPLARQSYESTQSIKIGLSLPDAVSPRKIGLNGDRRRLALGLIDGRVLPASASGRQASSKSGDDP